MNVILAQKLDKFLAKTCKIYTVDSEHSACINDIKIYAQKCIESNDLNSCYVIPIQPIAKLPTSRLYGLVPHVLNFSILIFTNLRSNLDRYYIDGSKDWFSHIFMRLKRFFGIRNKHSYFSDNRLMNKIFSRTSTTFGPDRSDSLLSNYIKFGAIEYGKRPSMNSILYQVKNLM